MQVNDILAVYQRPQMLVTNICYLYALFYEMLMTADKNVLESWRQLDSLGDQNLANLAQGSL